MMKRAHIFWGLILIFFVVSFVSTSTIYGYFIPDPRDYNNPDCMPEYNPSQWSRPTVHIPDPQEGSFMAPSNADALSIELESEGFKINRSNFMEYIKRANSVLVEEIAEINQESITIAYLYSTKETKLFFTDSSGKGFTFTFCNNEFSWGSMRILKSQDHTLPTIQELYPQNRVFLNTLRDDPRYAETKKSVASAMKFDSSVSPYQQEVFIDTFAIIILSGKADYLKETLANTTFKVGKENCYRLDGIVEVTDPRNIAVLTHETFHSFWYHHSGESKAISAMSEGFAIAAAQLVVAGEINLAERVYGTKLFYRDIGIPGYSKDIPLGVDISSYADETLTGVLDYIQNHDEKFHGFNWKDKTLTELYWNKVWVNLPRAQEDAYWSRHVPSALEAMDKPSHDNSGEGGMALKGESVTGTKLESPRILFIGKFIQKVWVSCRSIIQQALFIPTAKR